MVRDYYFDDYEIYKKYGKKKTLPLFKAYMVESMDDKLEVNTMEDYFSLSPEDAVKFMLSRTEDVAKYFFPQGTETLQDKQIAVIEFDVDTACLQDIPMMKKCSVPPYEKNNTIAALIHDKKWDMKIHTYHIQDIAVELNEVGQIKSFTTLTLTK